LYHTPEISVLVLRVPLRLDLSEDGKLTAKTCMSVQAYVQLNFCYVHMLND